MRIRFITNSRLNLILLNYVGIVYILSNMNFIFTELNATRATDISEAEEDVLYQKDVSFSAELEIAPSNRISKPTVSLKHIATDRTQRLTTTLPIVYNTRRTPNYTYTGEKSKQVDGLKSLIEDGVSKTDLDIIADETKENLLEANDEKVTTLGPSLEQKVSWTILNLLLIEVRS